MIRTLAFLALTSLPAAAQEPAPPPEPGLTMVMVEQHGCIYCQRWNAEAAPAWPNTEVGQAAPLRRVDRYGLPDDLTFASRPVFTPTFVLMRDGVELSRVEGYDPQFFWPMVERLVDEATAAGADG